MWTCSTATWKIRTHKIYATMETFTEKVKGNNIFAFCLTKRNLKIDQHSDLLTIHAVQ